MEKDRTTVTDMIIMTINDNRLSVKEEVEIMDILRGRGEGREKKRMSRCLAGIAEQELQKRVDKGEIKESTKNRYHPIFRRCFLETEIGNMDAAELSESVVKDFVMEANEFLGLNRNDMYFFMGMLQTGLNKMSDMGLLTFEPDRKMYRVYVESERGIRYIDNPYSPEETKSIMDWIEEHSDIDVRALAVGLWLTGNISPEEIVALRKEDCWDSGSGIEKGMFKECARQRFVTEANKHHPDEEQYVFMVRKDGRWKRLNERSLQIKLYYICQDIGIVYRAFHKNEAIIPGR